MILQLTIKATLILLAVASAALMLRRSSAATRHLAQVAGLVCVLALPVLVAAVPQWRLPLLRPTSAAATEIADDRASGGQSNWRPVPTAVSERRDAHRDAQALAVAAPQAPGTRVASAKRSPFAAALSAIPFGSALRWFGLVWALGVVLVLARLVVGWLQMTRAAFDATPVQEPATRRLIADCCKRLGVERAPRVLMSPRVRVPVLWGIMSPTVFLPESAQAWPQGRLRVVLLHEIAHLRRRDGLALLFGRLATAAWWFHPMAWIVDRGARRDCERACDDRVLATGEKPSEYAAHLLAIARELPRLRSPAGALAVVGTSQLEARVRAILRPTARRGTGRVAACAVLGMALLALLPVSSARLVAREPVDAPPAERLAASDFGAEPENDKRIAEADTDQVMTATRRKSKPQRDEYLLAHEGRYHEGQELFSRAYDHHREGEYDEAAPLFVEAAEAGYRVSTSLYNAGCGFAKMGDVGRAVRYIEQAIDAGFDDGSLLLRDSDLDPIRGDAEFRALLDRVRTDRDSAIGRRAGAQYDEIQDAYQELVDEGSTDGNDWYRVGSRLLQLREFDTSIEALGRAADLLENNQSALYNLACAYSLKGDTRAGLDHLERAVLAGFSSDERFENDTDLDRLRDRERFSQIRELSETLSLDRFRRTWHPFKDGDYSASRWKPAIDEFTAFTAKNPDIGRGWFNLGWALHHSRRHAEARKAFERQRSLGYRPANATYNIACTYAMENNRDAAFDWLGQAVDMGTISAGQILGDDDLESLAADPRFETLVERAIEVDGDDDNRRSLFRLLREKRDHKRTRVH